MQTLITCVQCCIAGERREAVWPDLYKVGLISVHIQGNLRVIQVDHTTYHRLILCPCVVPRCQSERAVTYVPVKQEESNCFIVPFDT